MSDDPELERLARLAHRLWSHWSMSLAEAEDVDISNIRLDNWRESWKPYRELSEASKDIDRDLVKRYTTEEPDYP